MNSKPDKKCEERGDIILLSEIITNSIYWLDNTKPSYPPGSKGGSSTPDAVISLNVVIITSREVDISTGLASCNEKLAFAFFMAGN